MLAGEIGRAVASARGRLGLSPEALASSTALDISLLCAVERGERLVSTAKLDRIATALGIDAFALYNGRDEPRDLVVLPRDVMGGDFQHADLPTLRDALERATALVAVSALLGRERLVGRLEARPPGAQPAEDGYHCARRVRRMLGTLTEPIVDLPGLLAERFDVPVIVAPLATRTLQAAAVRSRQTRAAAVVINPTVHGNPSPGSDQAWLVERVSICHELCHILFDEARGDAVDVVLDEAPREGQEKSAMEQRAGAFAAEMLMPALGLKALLLGEGRQTDTPARADQMVDAVRAHFLTPAEIAVNHLYNLGYVARVSAFRAELIQRAQAREVALTVLSREEASEAGRRVLRGRTREAHDQCLISDGMARALLGLEAAAPLPWEHEGR